MCYRIRGCNGNRTGANGKTINQCGRLVIRHPSARPLCSIFLYSSITPAARLTATDVYTLIPLSLLLLVGAARNIGTLVTWKSAQNLILPTIFRLTGPFFRIWPSMSRPINFIWSSLLRGILILSIYFIRQPIHHVCKNYKKEKSKSKRNQWLELL